MSSEQQYTLEVLISGNKDIPAVSQVLVGIPYDSIISLSVTESILTLLPKLELVVADKGTFMDANPIMDKDVLHVTINSNTNDPLTEINATFIVSGITILSDGYENQGNYVKISAYMAANNAFSPYINKSTVGTSTAVIAQTALAMGLKFKSNATGVESNYWHQDGNNYQFIKHVAKRAYIPADGVFVYGTLDGTINYMSHKIQNALPPRFNAKYSRKRVQNNVLLPTDLLFMYYDGYEIMDLTETYNNIANYGGAVSKYNLLAYVSAPLINLNKSTDLFNKKAQYVGQPVFSDRLGIIGDKKLQNTIYDGKAQNTFVKYQLFSNSISLNINNSTNVSLLDKVDLNLESTMDGSSVADPYSGDYLVTSISHSIVKDSGYTKSVLLCRTGINLSTTKKDYIGVI